MPRAFPVEFRRRVVALVRAGKPITTAAVELGVSAAAIHNRVRQDQIDRGERPGISTPKSIEMAEAKKRIWQLESEVEILKIAAFLLVGIVLAQKDSPGVDVLVEAGYRVKLCCRLLGVSSPAYYRFKNWPFRRRRCVGSG
jgi:transposase